MQSEVDATNEVLLAQIVLPRLIVHVVCLSDKLLVLFEEVVDLKGAHELRLLIIVLHLGPTDVLLHASLIKQVELHETV